MKKAVSENNLPLQQHQHHQNQYQARGNAQNHYNQRGSAIKRRHSGKEAGKYWLFWPFWPFFFG